MRRRGSPVRNAAICRRYRDGEKLSAIASDYDLTKARIEQIARAGGEPPRRRMTTYTVICHDCALLPVFPIHLVSVPTLDPPGVDPATSRGEAE